MIRLSVLRSARGLPGARPSLKSKVPSDVAQYLEAKKNKAGTPNDCPHIPRKDLNHGHSLTGITGTTPFNNSHG